MEGVDWKRVGSNIRPGSTNGVERTHWGPPLQYGRVRANLSRSVVNGASLNTRWVSGDWVALHNITSRGSTQKSHVLCDKITNSFDRVPKEVQDIWTIRCKCTKPRKKYQKKQGVRPYVACAMWQKVKNSPDRVPKEVQAISTIRC